MISLETVNKAKLERIELLEKEKKLAKENTTKVGINEERLLTEKLIKKGIISEKSAATIPVKNINNNGVFANSNIYKNVARYNNYVGNQYSR